MTNDGMGTPDPDSGPHRPPVIPRSFYNWLSIVGSVLAIGGVTGWLFLSLLDVATGTRRAYPGVMAIPFLLPALFGCALVGIGIQRERRRRKRGRGPSITTSISLDLVKLTRRRPFLFIVAGTVSASVLAFGIGFGALTLTEFTESNVFCGQVCHSVMNPEYQAFHSSPHSQLDCVDCHVGAGAESFLYSKLNGLGRLAALVEGSYERPIPTPVHDLRPARELCESCHTRDRLIGYVSHSRDYFLADEENTPVSIEMLVDVGGKARNGRGAGIHYHMFLGRKVEYVARDPQRQQIAWVRVTKPDGSTREYVNKYVQLSDEERAARPAHTMDCLDCHNRPAHRFVAPVDSVDNAIAAGDISRDLPYIKREAVIALDGDYDTTEEAVSSIAEHLHTFYEEEEPDVLEEQQAELASAIGKVQEIYRNTIFPEMKARWSSHPYNIGHLGFPGCFRCHNEDMLSQDGTSVYQGCDQCHLLLWQKSDGGGSSAASFPAGEDFLHPEDGEPFEEFTDCTECHTGGAALYE